MGLGIDLGRVAVLLVVLLVLASCGASPDGTQAVPVAAVPPAPPASPGLSAAEPAVVASAAPPAPSAPPAASTPDPYADVAPLVLGTARPEEPPPPDDPEQKRCPTRLHRHSGFSEGSQAYATVQRGWSKARVLEAIGGPTSCDRSQWVYVAGPYSGPEVTYRFTFERGVVVQIANHTIGCRYF